MFDFHNFEKVGMRHRSLGWEGPSGHCYSAGKLGRILEPYRTGDISCIGFAGKTNVPYFNLREKRCGKSICII